MFKRNLNPVGYALSKHKIKDLQKAFPKLNEEINKINSDFQDRYKGVLLKDLGYRDTEYGRNFIKEFFISDVLDEDHYYER